MCIIGVTYHRFTLLKLNRRIEEIEASEEEMPKTRDVDVPKAFRYTT